MTNKPAVVSIGAALLFLAASGAAMAQPGPGNNAFQFRLGGFLPERGSHRARAGRTGAGVLRREGAETSREGFCQAERFL